MILYRHAPPGLPFLWEIAQQPPGRWHGVGEGPVHYLADTPDGAWAEFLRHEEIKTTEELVGIQRSVWAIDVPDGDVATTAEPQLTNEILIGGPASYAACRTEAQRLRAAGAHGLRAPSAALVAGGAKGWRVEGGLQPAPARDGRVIVLFGARPDLVGWKVVDQGRPGPELLEWVRPLTA